MRRRHTLNMAGCVFAMALMIWGLWQLDLIVSGPVWTPGWSHPEGRYADDYFQSWLWKTTVGKAYDVLFFIIFISFWILFIALWTWED